ncbi:MAG: hypothetical protein IKV54_05095, partial [Clostridia bacterium]|nr:hypothetical protein [Clostridia bacterium]
KCPCCGGAIEFDSESQNMKCPYCDTEFEVEALQSFAADIDADLEDEMKWGSTGGGEWDNSETDGLISYICNTCGGEVVGDADTAATSCPFCGNPVIVTGKLSGVLKPDYVIPFKYDKEAAKAALREYYKGKRLLPKAFKDENRINEIKGIYVPFWLYDTEANADVRYKATKVRYWSSGNYNYTETSYYSVVRGGKLVFENVPVDGSSKMADELMESIEPFDFSEAVDFHTAYLSGYLADKYDVDSDSSIDRANVRIKHSTEEVFASTVSGYSSVMPEHSSVRFDNGNAKYALLPVWMLNTTYEGNTYTFAMNGQTGKMTGDLPLDRGAYKRWLFGLTAVIGAATMLLTYLAWLL